MIPHTEADFAMDARQLNAWLTRPDNVQFITPEELVHHVRSRIFGYMEPQRIMHVRAQCAVCGVMTERFYSVRWAKVCPLCVETARREVDGLAAVAPEVPK